MTPSPETCPGCSARIPQTRPPFCEFCGATLPAPAGAAVDAGSAEYERKLAALREAELARPRSSGSWVMLALVIVVAGAVLFLGCCAFLGVRLEPPR